MSLVHHTWDTLLDGAQVYESQERDRLRRALDLAHQLLQEFPRPVHRVVAALRSYSRPERRLPLVVEAPFQSPDEQDAIRWELAQKVLGPVYKATRISMPVTVSSPGTSPPPEGPGLLYPIV